MHLGKGRYKYKIIEHVLGEKGRGKKEKKMNEEKETGLSYTAEKNKIKKQNRRNLIGNIILIHSKQVYFENDG